MIDLVKILYLEVLDQIMMIIIILQYQEKIWNYTKKRLDSITPKNKLILFKMLNNDLGSK